MLRLYPIRLEDYQIKKLEETFEQGQIAPNIRKMINQYLEIKKDDIDILKKEKEMLLKSIRYIDQQLEEIYHQEAENNKNKSLEEHRQEYINANPTYPQMHRQKNISQIGYQKLCKDLMFESKADLKRWLDKIEDE